LEARYMFHHFQTTQVSLFESFVYIFQKWVSSMRMTEVMSWDWLS
jgi:hypothetical protein